MEEKRSRGGEEIREAATAYRDKYDEEIYRRSSTSAPQLLSRENMIGSYEQRSRRLAQGTVHILTGREKRLLGQFSRVIRED